MPDQYQGQLWILSQSLINNPYCLRMYFCQQSWRTFIAQLIILLVCWGCSIFNYLCTVYGWTRSNDVISPNKTIRHSVQFSHSVMSDSVIPWTAAHKVSLSITNSHSLLKLMSNESVMLYNHLILCHPLLLLPSIFPCIRVFSSESVPHIRWPKYWSFSFNIIPSNEHSGLISFRHCIQIFFSFFFPFIFISWRLITLQYCSGFCHILRNSHCLQMTWSST